MMVDTASILCTEQIGRSAVSGMYTHNRHKYYCLSKHTSSLSDTMQIYIYARPNKPTRLLICDKTMATEWNNL